MKEYAESRGGKCLSGQFISSQTKLLWECSDGHHWYSNSAKYNNSWCPKCVFFLSEEKCKFILESITGESFDKNRTLLGEQLELDGYCEKLKMAFEYQGYQHFEKTYYHHDSSPLQNRKRLDAKKKTLCNQKNILLLDIPYHINVSDSALLNYISNELKRHNVKLITEQIDWDNFVSEASIIKMLSKLAHKKGGRLISKSYRGCRSKLEFECQEHHRWFTTPGNIKLGSWCPNCNAQAIAQRNKHPISNIHNLAKENHSILMSETYKNNITPIEWECEICQKSWTATLNCMKTRLLKGKWCLFCNKQKEKKCLQVDEKHKM